MNLQGDYQIRISVRNLVEFIFRAGDLDSRRKTAADQEAMLEGSRIHRKIQKSMGGTYQAEVPLKLNLPLNCGGIPCELQIEGRADGIMESEDGGGVVIDEIKGMYRDVTKMDSPIYVHEAQAMCYAYMYLAREGELGEEADRELAAWLGHAEERPEYAEESPGHAEESPGHAEESPEHAEESPEHADAGSEVSDESSEKTEKKIGVQMTYVSLDRGDVKRFRHSYSVREISDWFCGMLLSFKKWVDFAVIHRNERNESLRPLPFPFPYREGQRDMVVSVYRAVARGKNLYVQAPTGIGKTMSAVFPAAKAMGEGRAEKVFYLTAKTVTRTVAEEAFSILSGQGAKLKTVSITAKEKLCVCESASCNPVDCPRAKGHFDRVNYAVYDIIREKDIIRREDILAYSEKYQVCPFEFCLDIADWMDGILCDYNYVFDPDVKLKRYFSGGNHGGYIFLVDEAHNLIDRGREMYSAKLRKEDFLAAKKIGEDVTPDLKKKLEKCNRIMLKYRKELEAGAGRESSGSAAKKNWMLRTEIDELIAAVTSVQESMNRLLEERQTHAFGDVWMDLYFTIRRFLMAASILDDHYRIYVEACADGFYVNLFCVNPSKNLKECMDAGIATILYSATFLPITYYKELLSGQKDDYAIYLPSPFPRENRALLAVSDVSARYTARGEAQYRKMAQIIAEVTAKQVGNYMVFLPSYKMLEAVAAEFEKIAIAEGATEREENPPEQSDSETAGKKLRCRILCQKNRMTEQEREEFLRCFTEKPAGKISLVAFCVLGGIFSEGIDLKRESLIGVFVIGTGIPQICTEREILRQYFEENGKNGFDYAYRFPGMNKVMQAAGRVIRTHEDTGVICLMDGRFREPANRNLFPAEWEDVRYLRAERTGEAAEEFWSRAEI